MAIFDYKCKECGFTDEYVEGIHLPKGLAHPDVCPKCGVKESMEKQSNYSRQSFDIIGSCYLNDWGKHAWKKNLSLEDQVSVLEGDKDPY